MTPDLFPTGPFRAAQWLTPVSFQYWFYYYLHQSVGERQIEARGAVKPSATASCQQHPPSSAPNFFKHRCLPIVPSLFVCVCLCVCASLFLSNYFRTLQTHCRKKRIHKEDRQGVFTSCTKWSNIVLSLLSSIIINIQGIRWKFAEESRVFLLPRRKIRF